MNNTSSIQLSPGDADILTKRQLLAPRLRPLSSHIPQTPLQVENSAP